MDKFLSSLAQSAEQALGALGAIAFLVVVAILVSGSIIAIVITSTKN